MKPALLALADGRVFRGEGCGATGEAQGEVVFNVSMVGYHETNVLLTTVGGGAVAR